MALWYIVQKKNAVLGVYPNAVSPLPISASGEANGPPQRAEMVILEHQMAGYLICVVIYYKERFLFFTHCLRFTSVLHTVVLCTQKMIFLLQSTLIYILNFHKTVR